MNIIGNQPSAWPQEGSLLSQNPWAADAVLMDPNLYGNYIYTTNQPTTSSEKEPAITFFYGPNLTEEQKNTPYRIISSTGNHYWPPILLDVEIQKTSLPRTTNTGTKIISADTYTATPIWIPNGETGTQFVLRKYTAATKFEIPQWDTPITGEVSFPVPGERPFSFGECLHPDINIPEMMDAIQEYTIGSGAVLNKIGIYKKWFFRATNFKTWLPYILYDRQSVDEMGMWNRDQMEVFPPNLPRPRRGLN